MNIYRSIRTRLLQIIFIVIALCLGFFIAIKIHLAYAQQAPSRLPSSISSQPELTTVTVDPVKIADTFEEVEIIGKVVTLEGGVIATEISGLVTEVFADAGDILQENSKIAALDLERLQLEKDLAEANLEAILAKIQATKAIINQAQLNLDRQAKLKNSPGFSKALFEDFENKLVEEKAKLQEILALKKEAIARLNISKLNLDRAIIKAPFPGIITQRYVHPGIVLNAGDQVVSLVNIDKKEIEIDLPRDLLPNLEENENIKVKLNADIYNAKIRAIVLQENVASRTIPVRLIPEKKLSEKIIVDQSISVLIEKDKKEQVLTIHKDALVNSPTGFMVFVINDKSQAEPRNIITGSQVNSRIEVLSGLKEEELVVTRGNERLRPFQPVKYKLLKNETN